MSRKDRGGARRCLCGVLTGYRHKADCPWPLFEPMRGEERAWEIAREAKQVEHGKQLASAEALHGKPLEGIVKGEVEQLIICLCGARKGSEHQNCPFPCYSNDGVTERRWEQRRLGMQVGAPQGPSHHPWHPERLVGLIADRRIQELEWLVRRARNVMEYHNFKLATEASLDMKPSTSPEFDSLVDSLEEALGPFKTLGVE